MNKRTFKCDRQYCLNVAAMVLNKATVESPTFVQGEHWLKISHGWLELAEAIGPDDSVTIDV